MSPVYMTDPTQDPTKAKHFSEGKVGLHRLPWDALEDVARVLDYGAKKYGHGNWQKGTSWMEFAGSAMRHFTSWLGGTDIDAESGLPHLAHAVTNLLFLLTYRRRKLGTDDRKHTT
jgi:hypothetical protein